MVDGLQRELLSMIDMVCLHYLLSFDARINGLLIIRYGENRLLEHYTRKSVWSGRKSVSNERLW
jgi:hypothetical protein